MDNIINQTPYIETRFHCRSIGKNSPWIQVVGFKENIINAISTKSINFSIKTLDNFKFEVLYNPELTFTMVPIDDGINITISRNTNTTLRGTRGKEFSLEIFLIDSDNEIAKTITYLFKLVSHKFPSEYIENSEVENMNNPYYKK